MTIDIKAIRAAAEAATPGPWEAAGPSFGAPLPKYLNVVGRTDENEMFEDVCVSPFEEDDAFSADMNFIATANPATVLAMCDEIERLQKEVHNLNWALGTEGYTEMATPEEQAEHEAGMADVQAILDRMQAAKDAHEAMEKDAARYRWIRHGDNDEIVMKGDCRGVYLPRNEHLDAAIDEQLELEIIKTYLAQDFVLNGRSQDMKEVYAAEHCGCIYESGFSVISLHQTKAGAYKAMRKHLIECHLMESTWINGQYRRNYYSACSSQLWKVTTYQVMQ